MPILLLVYWQRHGLRGWKRQENQVAAETQGYDTQGLKGQRGLLVMRFCAHVSLCSGITHVLSPSGACLVS